MMKKALMISLILALVLSLCSAVSAGSNEASPLNFEMILQQADELESSGATREEVIDFFATQGITVVSVTTTYVDENGNEVSAPGEFSTMDIDPIFRAVTNWFGFGTDYDYYNWARVEMLADLGTGWVYENYPASYDVLSINWDPTKLSYHSSGTSNSNIWLSDTDKRLQGTLIFSLYDNPLTGTTSTAWARLYPVTAGATTTAAKYTHTFDVTKKSTNYSGSASWTWGSPVTVGVSYSVNTTTAESNWSKAATAAINVVMP